jgi:hypothetical protein
MEEIAATLAAYGMWRTLRRARRRKVENVERFRFAEVKRPDGPADPQEESRKRFAAADCEQFLQDGPPGPAAPPDAEEEAEGNGPEGVPERLPLSMAWWEEERARQEAQPFRAGKVATVSLKFRPGLRPTPTPGHVLAWGPRLRTDKLPPEDRKDFYKCLSKDLRVNGCEPVGWDKVDVITPVRLVRHPVTGKARITHDSRPVNVRLEDSTAEMGKAADALLHGNVAAKIDLLMAFRHIGLVEADRRMLGFVVDGLAYRWNALTFGCSQSPELFAAALARATRKIHLPGGATIVVYVDDILVVAADASALDLATRELCRGLTAEGWHVALDKMYAYAMTKAPFLGLVVNFTDCRLQVARKKAARLAQLCDIAIRNSRVTLADLQRVGGLLAFMRQAAPECGLCRHGINAATAEAERTPGRTVSVKGELAANLEFWRSHAALLPGMAYPMADGETIDVATDAAGLPSLAYGGLAWPAAAPAPNIDAALGEAERWRSNPVAGAVVGGAEVYAGPFPANCASMSSSALETRALRLVLRAYRAKHGQDSLRGKVIRWLCDSQVAVGAAAKWRAKAEGLSAEVHWLLLEVRSAGCRLRPEWVAREAGWQPVVDAISKARWRRDTAEWKMDEADVAAACTSATKGAWSRPEIDLFATRGGAQAERWVTQWPEVGNAWTDAFARPWCGVSKGWAFPPFSAATAALRHACRGRLEVVIIIPRSTAVPARLRECPRVDLPALHLVDATGHRAHAACPVELSAVWIKRPPDGGS